MNKLRRNHLMKNHLIIAVAISLTWGSTVNAQSYSWAASNQAQGQPIAVMAPTPNSAMQGQHTSEYWTAERLRNAKQIDLPRATESNSSSEILDSYDYGERISEPGQAPTIKVKRNKTKLFEPIKNEINQDSENEIQSYNVQDVTPYASGTVGASFTGSRATPATPFWPFTATGRLYFSDVSGNHYTCSASVIKPRIILTAGHCVYDAVKKQWNTNFIFIPAYHNGSAPYGQWSWSWATTTNNWANGGGKVPNSGDYAVIEIQDNSIGQKIGSITGYYGYRTFALSPNHVTMLGYPSAFDSGDWMHRVDSQSYKTTLYNTVEYGSEMTNGASGGPWVENFGTLANGQSVSPGYWLAIVGLTSYGPVDTTLRYSGSSILDNQFTNSSKTGILDVACAHKVGNC